MAVQIEIPIQKLNSEIQKLDFDPISRLDLVSHNRSL